MSECCFLLGASMNCYERLEYKAEGAQKPECICQYMRISSTDNEVIMARNKLIEAHAFVNNIVSYP